MPNTSIETRWEYSREFFCNGFALLPLADCAQCDALTADLARFETGIRRGGVRDLLNRSAAVRDFASSARVLAVVRKVLGESAKPVRGIFFDKTPQANWKVPWHQDLTIAVREKIDTEGFTAWSEKDGITHVQPPLEILQKMLTLRLHLDDADESNGALKVLPATHNSGRFDAAQIQRRRATHSEKLCVAARGDALLMRPLLLHASSAGTAPKRRRVVHLEYAATELPNGLRWHVA